MLRVHESKFGSAEAQFHFVVQYRIIAVGE
jgi:hypothetical protein